MHLEKLYLFCSRQLGWHRNVLAFFLGICTTLALPPVFAFVFLIPAFTGLYWLLTSSPNQKRAFWDGWWWGYGFYLTGLYWICISMLTDVARYGWMIPFALFGLPAIIALYPACMGFIVYFARKAFPANQLPSIMAFAIIYSLTEYARGHLFTGFPWNLPGYAWAFSDAASQNLSWWGIYSLSFITVLLATVPALWLTPKQRTTALLIWASFASIVGIGAYRLYQADQIPSQSRFVPGTMLRLVQPDILQHHKWDPRKQQEMLEKQVSLSVSKGVDKVTHIIWPETAVPYFLTPDSSLTRLLASIAPQNGAIIVGGLRAENLDTPNWQVWNSLVSIDHAGNFTAFYDKQHLVPFGEYMPFRSFIPVGAEQLIAGAKDFSEGSGNGNLSINGTETASTLICYEAIFPSLHRRTHDAKWLLNITNDAWFGVSSGPYQHFHMSRMRAIERGLPLIRVANTGISAITDAYGRTLASLPLNQAAIIDHPLPTALNGTTYSLYGDFIFLLLMLTGALIAFILPKKHSFH